MFDFKGLQRLIGGLKTVSGSYLRNVSKNELCLLVEGNKAKINDMQLYDVFETDIYSLSYNTGGGGVFWQ